MPLDAICLAAVRHELSGKIAGYRIDKVQQPERDLLILSLRGQAEPFRLLISVGSGDSRVHITEHRYENPASPPMFCMLLRKYLVGARILSINQPPAERILEFELQAPDSMGVTTQKRLIIELIGNSSNIILVDGDGLVIDCLRRVGGELNDKRTVLPGLKYHRPPIQVGKVDPQAVSKEIWDKLYDEASCDKTAEKWLISVFSALSPLICREIVWRAYGQCDVRISEIEDGGDALCREFMNIVQIVNVNGFEPWSIADMEDSPRDFSFLRIGQYENLMQVSLAENFSAMLESHYTKSAQVSRMRQRASATTKTVKTARDRIVRKLIAQQLELEKTAQRDMFRQCGDIITANLHLMKKGQSMLTAQDFYCSENSMRDIQLNPLKTPQQNAAKYYKDYTKARTAEKYLIEQTKIGETEVQYLESVLEVIALAEGEKDLDEIRKELAQTGYVRENKQKSGKAKTAAPTPLRFKSSTGMQIFAGRNNIQNDLLTMKTALKSDMWLHVQKIHGSHVIILCKGTQPDETTLYEAAVIAAYYSSARHGSKVSVDFTPVRNVKKPPGGRPGMVIYTGFKTIVATPDEGLVNRLRV